MPPVPRRKKKLSTRFGADRFEDDEEDRGSRDGSLFVWTVVILLLIAVAIACWIGSFYIFGHPEKPFSYQILNKLKKLDPPKRFELTAAPRGEFLKPAQIIERYGRMSPRELDRANEGLLRNYLRNYKLSQDLVPYVVGTFNILDSFELTKNDFFESGVVALARSKETPGFVLEQVFTADSKVVPSLQRTLLTGLDIDLKRENELSAIIHVEKLPDGRIKATAVSILYPSYESPTDAGTVSLDPPEILNVAAGLPLVKDRRQDDADKKYAGFRRRAGLADSPSAEPAPAQNRLMRVERPVAVNLPTQPEIPAPSPTPALAAEVPRAVPASTPPVAPAASPAPELASSSPAPAPEVTPTPPPIVASSSGAWPTYAPGQMPRGRLLNVKDVTTLAGSEQMTERVYLQGNFVVTAAGQNRAVLRTQGALVDAIGLGGRSSNVRIIVEFPSGARPPAEGATFSRDARRPFQITSVREGADGQLNVYVREVTRP